ncbi:MAG: ATP-binding cassette domain-containing protein [Fluviicola sp.]|nr:ATP-binding cassette domain-containing protein [Fluviicola sp.]MBP6272695.1 ATP-binding cassette domain-containing protein [Fluviicola sp.]
MLRPKKEKKEKVQLTRDSYKKATKIFSYLKPYRLQYTIGWIFLVLSTTIGLVFPVLLGQLLGAGNGAKTSMADVIKTIDLSNINTVATALFILFGAQAVFSYFRVVLFTNVTESTLRDLRANVFQRLLNLPMDFFNRNTVGELTSRLSSDITQIQETLRTTVAEFFRQIVMIVGGISILLFISWKLALIMLGTVPVIAIVAVIFGRFIRRLAKEAQDKTASANAIAEEALTGIGNIKAFTNEVFSMLRFTNAINEIKRLNIKSGLWRGVFVSFVVFCMFGAIVFIIWQGLLLTEGPHPGLAKGDLYSFLMVTLLMAASIGSLPDFYAGIQKSIGATEKLMNLLTEISEKELFTGTATPTITGAITFDNVHFSYPQRPDISVLNGISFSIGSNQTLALVGASGGGKTTIASLVLNYYPEFTGDILFDSTSSKAIELNYLREHIAIVPQDVILFAGTIYDNIAFGKPTASKEEVEAAAVQANAFEFIQRFPDGFETQVGDRGIQLSGGQKQRIAIARAILKNPTILILDEATSALDSESEKLVQDALDQLMKGRTSIVIAHRLSTIRNADKIIVLQNGLVAEAGNHSELLATNGLYADLLKLQNSLG